MSEEMITVGFVFTNLNQAEVTLKALESIEQNRINIKVSCVVVDNNSTEIEKKLLEDGAANFPWAIIVFSETNLGYFKGLNLGIGKLRQIFLTFDYLVVGNNDLVFTNDFFSSLENDGENIRSKLVICPDLITLESEHQNPHIISGVSRFREVVWDLYFFNFYLARLISLVARCVKKWAERPDYKSHHREGFIYQGYGACYILTPLFFEVFEDLWSPGFLMGEEFYLAMQLETVQSQMYYWPALKVYHHDHTSVNKLPSKKLWEYSKEYHSIYRHFFSPYRICMRTKETMDSYTNNTLN